MKLERQPVNPYLFEQLYSAVQNLKKRKKCHSPQICKVLFSQKKI